MCVYVCVRISVCVCGGRRRRRRRRTTKKDDTAEQCREIINQITPNPLQMKENFTLGEHNISKHTFTMFVKISFTIHHSREKAMEKKENKRRA